jgi:threonine/homoserine efflux transporter RhtA
MVFAILLAILPIIPAYIGEFHLTGIQQMLVLQGIAACVAVLRYLTTQPLEDK